jgi:hypothetical protein
MENESEYFAEAVQSFVNANRYSKRPMAFTTMSTAEKNSKAYDPVIYEITPTIFH